MCVCCACVSAGAGGRAGCRSATAGLFELCPPLISSSPDLILPFETPFRYDSVALLGACHCTLYGTSCRFIRHPIPYGARGPYDLGAVQAELLYDLRQVRLPIRYII